MDGHHHKNCASSKGSPACCLRDESEFFSTVDQLHKRRVLLLRRGWNRRQPVVDLLYSRPRVPVLSRTAISVLSAAVNVFSMSEVDGSVCIDGTSNANCQSRNPGPLNPGTGKEPGSCIPGLNSLICSLF
jgi:hypothetical protein